MDSFASMTDHKERIRRCSSRLSIVENEDHGSFSSHPSSDSFFVSPMKEPPRRRQSALGYLLAALSVISTIHFFSLRTLPSTFSDVPLNFPQDGAVRPRAVDAIIVSEDSAQLRQMSATTTMMMTSYFCTDRALTPIKRHLDPDFGGLLLEKASSLLFRRTIRDQDEAIFHQERQDFLDYMNNNRHSGSNAAFYDPFDDQDFPQECVRPQWAHEMQSSCNSFHESLYFDKPAESFPEQNFDIHYLESGSYRDAFAFASSPQSPALEDIVVKKLRHVREVSRKSFYQINAEALMMDHLEASKVTSDIYGRCGTSLIAEGGTSEITCDIVPRREGCRKRGRIPQQDLDLLQKTFTQ